MGYAEVNYNEQYLIRDTIRDTIKAPIWNFPKGEKMILGYKCEPALRITPEKGDSILIWYTNEFGDRFGQPRGYEGIPGTVLEIYDQQTGFHLRATKVKRGDYSFFLPQIETITFDEFRRRKNF